MCGLPLGGAQSHLIKDTPKDNSGYKIPFYCQNSSHKNTPNRLEEKDKSSSRVAGDSNHFRNATLKKGMLPENQRYKRTTV